MSLASIPQGLVVIDKADKAHFIPFVCAIYDLKNMIMWRVERKNGNILAQKLDEYLAEKVDVSDCPLSWGFFFDFPEENDLSFRSNVWKKRNHP